MVSLNEVDSDAARSGRTDEASYLAQATGMHDVFGANLVQADGRRFGNAILSRYPVIESHNTPLPRVTGSEPRGLLHARTVRVDGRVGRRLLGAPHAGCRGTACRGGSTQAEAIARILRAATGRRSSPAT